ncbi:MAG: leucine--tRNA ligase [Clostridiales bacterium]|nr:leucine--tRNA ligase [Clostridiales bacterium]
MQKVFNPDEYEKKWREIWEEEQLYNTDNPIHSEKEKYYCLDMFPYPSGKGLHVGHWSGYVLSDVWSRYKMLHGYNVLHPMGWDNFGLPAETDAINRGIHPTISTKANIENIRRQLKEIGTVYDWSKELNTSSPEYYKWTQWIFLKMFKRGLAYQKEQPVNWCNHCKVVLANEEVEGGKCERCGGTDIEKRMLKQWMLKITEYAERLLNDLDKLDWSEKVKEMQRNWIGKSIGAKVKFTAIQNDGNKQEIEVFTTRPDTLFGATFMVLAPEYPLLDKLVTPEKSDEVKLYVKKSGLMSNVDRQKTDKEKTGVFTGAYAINPVNGKKVPIWISDYVLMDYGTGAIMAVPAHDERDFAFAKKFNIDIIEVIKSENSIYDNDGNLAQAYTGDGVFVNSEYLNGLSVEDAKKKVIENLKEQNKGEGTVNYKLRDWIFARQRYWGEPIPVIHCKHCGIVPVPEEQLPVTLPMVESYKPTDDGKSPLSAISDWVKTKCPVCGQPAERETDTMPQWAGSSWYFLRYPSVSHKGSDKAFALENDLKEWLPVDMYVGGIEHAVLHLLYSRFWTKVLYDEGLIDFDEPFQRLFNQGMICRTAYRCHQCNKWVPTAEVDFHGEEPHCPTCSQVLDTSMEKMSKSKGNVVNPDDLVNEYCTDALRMYELFAGDATADSEWNDDGIKACWNLLKKAWNFVTTTKLEEKASAEALKPLHILIKNIDNRINLFKFNTAISAIMEFMNTVSQIKSGFSKEYMETFLVTISPFAPHFAEELWRDFLSHEKSIFLERFPAFDKKLIAEDSAEIAVQINGKIKARFMADINADKNTLIKLAKELAQIKPLLEGKTIVKEIAVPKKLVNIVVK